MLEYDGLNQSLKDLYDSLKDAIQNNGDVAGVLKDKGAEAIALVVGVVDDNGSTLLIDAIGRNDKAAIQIRERIDQQNISTGHATGHATDALESKAVFDVLHNNGKIAKKILDWAGSYKNKNVKKFIENRLIDEFKKAIKSGDKDGGFDKANKFYAFGEWNKPNIFKDELIIKGIWLSDTIAEIKHNRNEGTQFLENILKFAKNSNIHKEVFKAKVGSKQKTLLEFAKEEGVKKEVEGVIRDAGIDSNSLNSAEDNNQQSTFCSRNIGKIAFGGVGLFLLVGGVAAACTLGQPLVGAAAIGAMAAAVIGAAMMLVSVLAITTDRGYEKWGSAEHWLSDLFLSKQGPQEQQI